MDGSFIPPGPLFQAELPSSSREMPDTSRHALLSAEIDYTTQLQSGERLSQCLYTGMIYLAFQLADINCIMVKMPISCPERLLSTVKVTPLPAIWHMRGGKNCPMAQSNI